MFYGSVPKTPRGGGVRKMGGASPITIIFWGGGDG